MTFVQAQSFYLRVPELVTAVRQEMAYPGSATAALPILPGPRYEPKQNCPIEHLLAMQRTARKTAEVVGTRSEEPGLRGAVLRLTAAHTGWRIRCWAPCGPASMSPRTCTSRQSASTTISARGAGTLRVGIATGAPDTEGSEEPDEASGTDRDWNPGIHPVSRDRDYEDRGARTSRGMGGGMGGGMGFGTLLAAMWWGTSSGTFSAGCSARDGHRQDGRRLAVGTAPNRAGRPADAGRPYRPQIS